MTGKVTVIRPGEVNLRVSIKSESGPLTEEQVAEVVFNLETTLNDMSHPSVLSEGTKVMVYPRFHINGPLDVIV